MKILLLHLFSLVVFAVASLHAADDSRLAVLRVADDERVASMLAADRSRLDAVLGDDLRYAHSSGVVDTKASFIDALSAGRTKYLSLNYDERNFTFPAPGIALMTGRVEAKVQNATGVNEMALSFLAVWREENGRWRFLAWQSARLSPPSVAK